MSCHHELEAIEPTRVLKLDGGALTVEVDGEIAFSSASPQEEIA